MSVVSAKLSFDVIPAKKVRKAKAVGFKAGDPVFENFSTPEGVKSFSKGHRKQASLAPVPATSTPLMFLQSGYEEGRAGAFQQQGIGIPLKVPIHNLVPMMADTTEEFMLSNNVPIDFSAGLRPGPRGVIFTFVDQPAAVKFRPGRAAGLPKFQDVETRFRDEDSELLAQMLTRRP